MKKATTKHVRTSALLAAGALGSAVLAYRVADAKGATQAQTIDVDFGTQTPHGDAATLAPHTSDLQGQFVFLLILTTFGMVGIVGILRDFRHGHAR